MCGFHNIFMKNITTYLNYDSHWRILINLTWLREPSYFPIKQCCFLLAGWILSRLCPSVELISNSPYCLVAFSAPHEQHKGGSINWAGETPEMAGHWRWLCWRPQVSWLRRGWPLPFSPGARRVTRRPWGPHQWQLQKQLSRSAAGVGTCFIMARVLLVIRQNYKQSQDKENVLPLECWQSFIKCLQTMILNWI